MKKTERSHGWNYVLKTWPPLGAAFVVASFVCTVVRLYLGYWGSPDNKADSWLEPLGAILGGTGALLITVVLIRKRADNARAQADTYSLAHGLATGYYFNFVRHLAVAMRDPANPIHAEVKGQGEHKIAGLIVGLTASGAVFGQLSRAKPLGALTDSLAGRFELKELKVSVASHSRNVFVQVARSWTTHAAILVDIPTTLAVIPEFADFVLKHEADMAGTDDEHASEAVKNLVMASQADQFQKEVENFLRIVNQHASMEPREMAPGSLLHMVPVTSVQRRLDELAGH